MVRLVMSLKRGTSKNSEKVPYYFLCQQQNICIMNCTDISLQILGCECSFSVQHALLNIWPAEMPHSCISELLSVLLPGHWWWCRGPLLSVFPAFTQICMYFSLLWFFLFCSVFFTFFFLFSFVSNADICGYILKVLLKGLRRVLNGWCLTCAPELVWGSTWPLPCSPWGHWEALSKAAHCTFQKFPCGQTGYVWHSAV